MIGKGAPVPDELTIEEIEEIIEAFGNAAKRAQTVGFNMVEVHAGIEQLLQFLKGRGVHLAVFTGKGRRTTAITMAAAGLQQYFQLIVSGNDVTRHKPDPEGILKVLTTFHVPPGQVLMVGDSLADISAARGAGVRVASVLWDSYDTERVLRAGADYVFHNVDEMFRWIRTRIR